MIIEKKKIGALKIDAVWFTKGGQRTDAYFNITGNTYEHRDALKALGAKWDSMGKKWVIDTLNKAEADSVESALEELANGTEWVPRKRAGYDADKFEANVSEEELEQYEANKIYKSHSMDFRTTYEHAHNGSRWFCRRIGEMNRRTRWEVDCGPFRTAYPTGRNCRLPKAE